MPFTFRSRGLRALLAVAAVAAAVVASAAQTQPISFDVTPQGSLLVTNWTNGAPASKGALLTPSRFDSTLGTLTGVSLTINWSGEFYGDIINQSNDVNSYDRDYQLNLLVRDSSANVLSTTKVLDNEFSGNLAVGGDDYYNTGVKTGSFTYSTSDTSILSNLFSGTGNVGLQIRAQAGGSYTAGGNIQWGVNTLAGATGSIVYTYTPQAVPEPASMAALGFGALGLVRRRKGGAK